MIAEAVLAAAIYTARPCTDPLVDTLRSAGFTGQPLKFAWAIAMRESRGNERAISSGGDYGLFQWNRAAWNRASWWDERRLLDADYNAAIAYDISQGGKTFYPWDINGRGYHSARYSSRDVYRVFVKYVREYPC